jgi:hypothetical protein
VLGTNRIILIAATCCLLLAGGCGSDDEQSGTTTGDNTTAADGARDLPRGADPVKLDPADFTTKIDNPYWPMAPDGEPGRRWVIRSEQERVVVTVTDRKKNVAGIDALVVNDTVTDNNGDLVEVTDDWYGQDSAGNVWYLGENVKDYKNGKVVSTGGSWEHGVDGAYAGVAIPADPRPGLTYRQEYYKGEAEDQGKVLSLSETVTVPFGTFEDVLKTEDTTPLEPDVVEHKYYARGVGPLLNELVSGGGGREELVRFTKQ